MPRAKVKIISGAPVSVGVKGAILKLVLPSRSEGKKRHRLFTRPLCVLGARNCAQSDYGSGDFGLFCGIFRTPRSALPLYPQLYHLVAVKTHQDFIFNALVNKAFLKLVRPKSDHSRVPNCNYAFSDSRDSAGCLCGLHIANKDRARGILFLAPPRVLVGRSHAVWAQSQTQAHKPWIAKGRSVLAGRSKGSD